jgi:hypothetical protein
VKSPERFPAVERLAEKADLNRRTRRKLRAGVHTRVYSPFYKRMADHALRAVEAERVDPHIAVRTLLIPSKQYSHFDRRLSRKRHQLPDDALKTHQENVLDGTSKLIDPKYATSKRLVRKMNIRANRALEKADPATRKALTELDYESLFRGGGIDPAEINTRLLLGDLDKTLQIDRHSTVCNIAIGPMVARVREFLASQDNPGDMRFIDIGSGRGLTLASIAISILQLENHSPQPEISITSLETNSQFYKKLTEVVNSDQDISALGLEVVSRDRESVGKFSEFGKLITINTDAATAIQNADMSEWMSPNDITVVTANYSFHCIPQSEKTAIMEKLSELPNVILLLGDSEANTSAHWRQHDGFASYMPFDTGNQKLAKEIVRSGYNLVDLNKMRPAAMHERMRKRQIREQKENSQRMWIAYKGDLAEKALGLVPVAA